jgi:hypothetical protein
MPQYRASDILLELIELSHERIDEVRCQIAYYRASVYKQETADQINLKVEQLERVSVLFGDDHLVDVFSDFAAVDAASGQNCAPGECSFAQRVTGMLHALELHLSRIYRALTTHTLVTDTEALAAAVRVNRQDVLALCNTGSRHWTFFQSFE